MKTLKFWKSNSFEIFSDNYNWPILLEYLEISNPKYLHFLNKQNKHRDTKKKKLL